MFEVRGLCLFLPVLWLCLASLTNTTSETIAKPGCQRSCGDVAIRYPFGIGRACSYKWYYSIDCNFTSKNELPKPFLTDSKIEVLSISIIGQMLVKSFVATRFYKNGVAVRSTPVNAAETDLSMNPLVYSDTENKLFVIGCDDFALLDSVRASKEYSFRSGCIVGCSSLSAVINGSCSGIGCCQTSIPKGLYNFTLRLQSFDNHSNVSHVNPNGYAFIGDPANFSFNAVDLIDPNFKRRTKNNVPIVLEWYIWDGDNIHDDFNCKIAQKNSSTYACHSNSRCYDFNDGEGGYRCKCLLGYEGNPYLHPGCTDIDECEDFSSTTCSHICKNTLGSYNCTCSNGYHGDGFKDGTSCSTNNSQLVTRIALGLSMGLVLLLVLVSWIHFITKKRKLLKIREKFFEQNGGMLLKQKLSTNEETMESSNKIFSADELKVATNNYHEDRILGKGGYGTVYKGVLKDGREVAIKKSRVADQTQVEQFINEVVILTQINHRNVVKLLGCCLETEVPLLVYEFISNGTLHEHIHRNRSITSWLTWANCIKLAAEVADALSYLHSAASIPIIHRDVKSSNVLLDESHTAKISDFGASRLVPIDQTHMTTLVQGTLGYLDPEYFQTSQLTEKSDVYSFGVLLAELLTREKPISSERRTEDRNLAIYFLLSVKENRLMEALDPQLVKEAREEHLFTMVELVRKCLNVRGEDRPTMKEVALELQGLKKQDE